MLAIQDERAEETRTRTAPLLVVAALGLVALLAGVGYFGFSILERLEGIEQQMATLDERSAASEDVARQALERAGRAQADARAAAEGRLLAEAEAAEADERAAAAETEAEAAARRADQERARAEEAAAEAERVREQARAQMAQLEEALGKVAETRRTALGLVMNLGEDALKFDFNKAEIRPENREILSRIAGILMTSEDYTISINGHTDDVGSQSYNQMLSERRAQAVYDYLVRSGLPPEIMTVRGWGKSKPLVKGTSESARAKNRRVELGIVNARVNYRNVASERD